MSHVKRSKIEVETKISVVIPCHNCDQWIGEALDSVLAQTLSAFEVVIVLDRCSDESRRVIERHALDATILETNFGNAAAARNAGVDVCSGIQIAFLDADDWWESDHLNRAASLMADSGDVAYFGHWMEYFSDMKETRQIKPLNISSDQAGLTSERWYEEYVESIGWPTSGMVVSRERFLEVGGFDETQLRRHDTEMFARVVHSKTWSYSPKPCFFYRRSVAGSISSNKPECRYYKILSDQKIASHYGKDLRTDRSLRAARSCVSTAIKARDPELLQRCFAIAGPLLSPWRKCLYRLTWRFCGLGAPLLRLLDK